MKKDALFGWQSVFAFTLRQLLKSKAVITMMILLFAFSTFAMPVSNFFSGSKGEKKTSVKTVTIYDETGLELKNWLDITKTEADTALPEKIEFADGSYDDAVAALEKEEKSTSLVVKVAYADDQMLFSVDAVYNGSGSVSEGDATKLSDLIGSELKIQIVDSLGITEEQMEYLNADVETKTETYSGADADKADEPEKKNVLNSAEYMVTIIVLTIVIMLVSLGGEQTASAIAQEKTSKVVELLLTSVRPLAMMIGKVLAVFTLTLLNLAVFAGGFFLSSVINDALNPGTTSSVTDWVASIAATPETGESASLATMMLPLAVIIVLIGVLFYTGIAAIAGASVSRMEELAEGLKLFTTILIVGAYFAMFVVIMDMAGAASDGLRMVATYLPFSSCVFVPGYLILGKITASTALISLAVLIISTCVLFWFAASVYESLIYYKGKTLKLKDIMALGKKGGKKGNE